MEPENKITAESSAEHKFQKHLLEMGKKQLFYSRITAFLLLAITLLLLISGIFLLPKAISVLSNAETITQEFKEQNIAQIIEDIDSVTRTSQDGVEQAVERLNQVDLESLNKAIQNLESVLRPLAKFFDQQ